RVGAGVGANLADGRVVGRAGLSLDTEAALVVRVVLPGKHHVIEVLDRRQVIGCGRSAGERGPGSLVGVGGITSGVAGPHAVAVIPVRRQGAVVEGGDAGAHRSHLGKAPASRFALDPEAGFGVGGVGPGEVGGSLAGGGGRESGGSGRLGGEGGAGGLVG